MSDPVTNVEIEDVLSSIRRLVADDDRTSGEEHSSTDHAPDRAGDADLDGPLVLTPSLRVEQEDAPVDDDSFAVARRVARLEAAVTVQKEEFEPDGSEDEPMFEWSAHELDMPMFHSRERVARELDTASDTTGALQPMDPDTSGAPDDPADIDMTEDEPTLEEIFGTTGMPTEDLLRDLVAEVLRDELAGALGERITRNVRKLVRREIHRILDSLDAE